MGLYVGIDVGMINLAICFIDPVKWRQFKASGENSDPGIVDWVNLRVLPEAETCRAPLKTGAKKGQACGKKACWKAPVESENEYFCGAHARNIDKKVKYNPPNTSKMKMRDIQRMAFERLDQVDLFKQAESIVIESQPKIGGRMKKFSLALEAYFVLRLDVDHVCSGNDKLLK